MGRRLLVINQGSTSTKIAVYDEHVEMLNQTIRYDAEEIQKYDRIYGQYELRKKTIEDVLKSNNIPLEKFDAVVARGGLMKPLKGGAYIIDKKMADDSVSPEYPEHAANLGVVIVYNIAKDIGVKAYTVNPAVVDELDDVAKISGIPEIERTSVFHALNHKGTAMELAKRLGRKYEDLNLIVAHMGGGITVGAHKNGRVVDVNNGMSGEGPFSPERSGGLPVEQVVKMCFSGKYTMDEIIKRIHGNGGMAAYVGTTDCKSVAEKAKKGDSACGLILEAMTYQIAKEIGSMAVVLNGNVDGILLTGGLAYNKELVEKIIERVSFISKVYIVPGEKEMESLRDGTLMAIDGKIPLHEYI